MPAFGPVASAQRSRAPIQRLANQVAGWFVPSVIAAAILAFIAWSWFGPEPRHADALVAAVSVLIILPLRPRARHADVHHGRRRPRRAGRRADPQRPGLFCRERSGIADKETTSHPPAAGDVSGRRSCSRHARPRRHCALAALCRRPYDNSTSTAPQNWNRIVSCRSIRIGDANQRQKAGFGTEPGFSNLVGITFSAADRMMRTAIAMGLIGAVFVGSGARAEEWRQYTYPKSGFSAEFTGTVREIDIKPDAKTRSYILKTSIYQQAAGSSSFSVTAREYRFGMPDLRKIAGVILAQLRCTANVKIAPIETDGLALSGDRCLADGSSFVARLIGRGRWLYQALAVVPPTRAKDAGQFVAALHLLAEKQAKPPHHRRVATRSRHPARPHARRSVARRAPTPPAPAPATPAWRFSSRQNWPPPIRPDTSWHTP